ncbi:MAG: YARHG domain-containing protein [Bacteroidota bacterium]
MRTYQLLFCFGLGCALFSCTPNNSKTSKTETVAENVAKSPEELIFDDGNESRLKEELFFHLREQVVNVDEYTFVKFEELRLNGLQFEYHAIVTDIDLLTPIATDFHERKPKIILASYVEKTKDQEDWYNYEYADTIKITGSLKLLESFSSGSETRGKEVNVLITADFSKSYENSDSYSGPKRILDAYPVQQNLIVRLNEPRIYPKSMLYLKARVSELTEEDLADLSKDEMAYLRNEIFARHGHTFKTDKMRVYFENQSWYDPFFENATDFLNEMEKRNTQFIKSMES